MKRILIFSTAYFPFVGGAEVAVKEITDRIFDKEFVMITARMDAKLPMEEKIGNVIVYRIGKGNKWDKFRLIWEGYKKAKVLGKFDTVWSIMASYAGFASLRYKKRNKTVPFILTLQEGDSKWDIYKHVWWCWCYFKQIFKHADKIQAISNYLAKWAKDMGAKCPVEVVSNGVDLSKFIANSSQPIERENILSKLGFQAGSKIIISASRLVKKNGIEDLISAISLLPTDTHLLIVGTGGLEDRLKQQTKFLQISNRVHFVGNLAHADLPKYLGVSDVFCRPSLSEGLGNVFLEAMAVGIPIVGTKVGGIPDFLSDGMTGLFCEVGNPRDIAEKIKILLADTELRTRLGVNGRKLVEEKYSWDLISRRMSNLLSV